jgi:hypothetical protein
MDTKLVRTAEKRKPPNAGKGRKMGVPNKATANAREAIARFVDGNSDRLQGWLDDIAADEKQGPKAALDAFMGLLEYHVPKLARTEHVGDGGGPVIVQASSLDERL